MPRQFRKVNELLEIIRKSGEIVAAIVPLSWVEEHLGDHIDSSRVRIPPYPGIPEFEIPLYESGSATHPLAFSQSEWNCLDFRPSRARLVLFCIRDHYA